MPEEGLETLHTEIFDLGFWSYTTVLFRADAYFEPLVNDHESADVAWIALDKVDGLPLHPGFATSWPSLHGIIDRQGH